MRTRTLSMLAAAALATPAMADFIPGNLVVSLVGDGSAALTNAANPVFLSEYTTAGSLVRSLALPTAASGANRRFSVSGSATSEGHLSRSTDGRFLVIGGYDAAIGTASVVSTTSAANPRVVARVGFNDAIDTSTALGDAYSANNIRSVFTTDGADIWTAGTASSGGGVRYTTLGATTSTQLSTTITNIRVVNIFNGQLYVSSSTGAFQGVSAVGTGIPTTSGQTITSLAGMPSTASSYDFHFANASTLYIADDRTSAAGGLQKWTFDGSSWSLQYTLSSGTNIGLRGLVGGDDGSGNALLYAISTDNKLVSVIDTGAGSAFSTLATAPANTAFRSVEFAPVPTPGTLALLAASGLLAIRRRRSA